MKGPGWWALLLILFVLAIIFQRGMMALLVLVLACAAALGLYWTLHSLDEVSYRRSLGESQIDYGQETTLALQFTNRKLLPLAWLTVSDVFPGKLQLLTDETRPTASLEKNLLVSLVSLRWYERVTHTHRVVGAHRGRFRLGPAEMVSGDVFGLRQSRREMPQVDHLTVYPKIVPVGALGLPAGRPMGDWLARRRVIEDPLRFAQVREYVSGDNPRYIHWRATARTGSLQTKVFEPSDTLALMLAVDVQTVVDAYAIEPEYLELAATAAASLALEALNQHIMVGLCANSIGDAGEYWQLVKPGRHPSQAQVLLENLAALEEFRGRRFEDMLQDVRRSLPLGTTVVAISATPQPAALEALAAMQASGHPVILLTIGEDAPELPASLPTHHLGGRDAWRRLESLELA
jgi:uncharacterized protein (DUF58 family)